jgi:DNA-binding CsgD family transcriptional regulator
VALHTRAGGILSFVAVEQGVEPDPELMAAATATESTATRSLSYSRAEHLLANGRLSAAVVELLAIGEFERRLGWEGPTQYPWRSQAALALDKLGDADRARTLAAEELELARAYGAPRPVGIALRAIGLLAGTPAARRKALLGEAVDVLASSGAELEYARALVALGTALRLSGSRAAARKQLTSGYERANRCGSTRLAGHAWQELLAAGARPRRKELQGVASLTPSERRIAELAAAGSTNREIAQTLYVTAKTVETHLGHAYTKLGISSRVELEAALR